MFLDYNGFHYRPDYEFELRQNGRVVARNNRIKDDVCFRRIFNAFMGDRTTTHEGYYTLWCHRQFVEHSGNYCSLEKPQILKLLRYMRRVFDIKINFAETEENYIFKLKVVGKPIKHKFILTFCRVFYEFPYNEIAKDVFRIREKGTVRGINYANKSFLELYNTVCAVYQDNWGGGHALFCYPCTDMSVKVMRKAFEEGRSSVQSVYEGTRDTYDKCKRPRGWDHVYEIDWDVDFDKRMRRYSENFKILRQQKYEESVRRRAAKVVQ